MASLRFYLFFILSSIVAALLIWISLNQNQTIAVSNPQALSPQTIHTLQNLSGKITIQSFSTPEPVIVRQYIQRLINQFKQHKPDLHFQFINPDLTPNLVRKHQIRSNGQLLIQAFNKTKTLSVIREKTLIDTLFTMQQKEKHLIGFITGHEEQSPYNKSVLGFSNLYIALKKMNILAISLNLNSVEHIPENTRAIVLASPRKPYSEQELEKIKVYLASGGQIIWLLDPNSKSNTSLSKLFNIDLHPGVVIDLTSQEYRNAAPSFSFIKDYPAPEIISNKQFTILPESAALSFSPPWQPIFKTNPKTWTETQPITGNISFTPTEGEQQGPLTLGIAQKTPYKAIIIGDSDFLTNRYIGNAGNLATGIALFQWLLPNQAPLLEPLIKPQHQLQLSDTTIAGIALLLFIGIPTLFLMTGLLIWIKRRRT